MYQCIYKICLKWRWKTRVFWPLFEPTCLYWIIEYCFNNIKQCLLSLSIHATFSVYQGACHYSGNFDLGCWPNSRISWDFRLLLNAKCIVTGVGGWILFMWLVNALVQVSVLTIFEYCFSNCLSFHPQLSAPDFFTADNTATYIVVVKPEFFENMPRNTEFAKYNSQFCWRQQTVL